jgi:hypothetical protein
MNRFHNESSTSGRRWLTAFVAGIAVAGAGTALAQPSQPPTLINSCSSGPYTITQSGFYRVNADLTAKSNQDCIDIEASTVALDLHGHLISGSPTGIVSGSGVNIIPTKKNPAQFVVVEGANSFIVNFDVGIQDQGNYATVEDVNTVNNVTTGVWLNGVSYSQVTNTDAYATSDEPHFNPQQYGFQVTSSYSTGVGDGVLEANEVYGLWIQKSNSTRVWNLFSENNGNASIYLGCTSNGYNPLAETGGCSAGQYGGNLIYDDVTDNDDPLMIGDLASTDYGIAVDRSEEGDEIFQNSSHDNNAAKKGDINAAGDPNCKNNLYFLNNQEPPGLGNVSPACVQTN